MVDEYNVANRFKLTEHISTEPFGSYHVAETSDNKKYLLLLLTPEASILARPYLTKLNDKIQEKLLSDTTNYTDQIWPVLELIDPLKDNIEADNSIIILMPYLKGKSLAAAIKDFKKPLSLRKSLKLLSPLTKRLSEEHKAGKFHGFINFSTIWITDDKKLKLLGFELFNNIFEKLEIKSSELYHPKISSCLSEDNQIAKITFSIASDYYALLIIVCSLLQGAIPNTKNYLFTPLSNVNKKARRLLTADYYRDVYQENISLDEWFGQLQSTIKWPILENLVALILVVGLVTVVSYQNREQLKSSILSSYYDSMRGKYVSLLNYFQDKASSNKLAAASGSIDKNSTSLTKEASGQMAVNKVTSLVSNLDVENNLFNYTANGDYKKINSTATEVPVEPNLKQVTPQPVIASTEHTEHTRVGGFSCVGAVCREPIIDSITGPKMIKAALLNDQFWLMQSPLSRKDYYTYCYFVEDCKQKKDIANNKVLKCLFENTCTDETELWLNYPITGLEMHDLNKYISWLNKVTNGGYEVLPDKFWPIIASKFKPDQNCIFIFNGSGDYIASNKPELVTVDGKLAVRTTAKLIHRESVDEPQCQTLLTDNASSSDKNLVIRLAKKIA